MALEAARRAAASYANGVVLVELAPLRDPELVVPTIAQAVGIADVPQPLEALAEALRSQELLLLLDNAEHVQEATPTFVGLLARAPRLTILVTSRTVLHLTGEHVFPVAPLEIGAAQTLFEQRARALPPDFRVTEDDLGTVRGFADASTGSRSRSSSPPRTSAPSRPGRPDRLTERLSFLAGGPHDLPARQQTLYETLDWSYDLLSEEERSLLAGLSVFRGGATLAAVAEVCLAGDEGRALDLGRAPGGRARSCSSAAAGRGDTVRPARSGAAIRGRPPGRARCGLHEEPSRRVVHGTGRAGRAGVGRREPGVVALRARGGARQHARRAGVLRGDGRARAGPAPHGPVEPVLVRPRPSRRGEAAPRGGAAVRRRPGPEPAAPGAGAGASIALLQGDYVASTAFAESALDSARRTGEPKFVANALSNLGAIVLAGGDAGRAAVVLDEALGLAREVGDERITALALNNLGDLALSTGDYRRAGPLFEESHGLLRSRRDTANIARSLFNLGAVDLMLGENGAADARFRESLELARTADDKEDLAWCLEGFAALAGREGDGVRAATLLGAAGALLARIGADHKPFERRLHQSTESAARATCDPGAFEDAMEHGASMSIEEVLDGAVGAPRAGKGSHRA